MMERFGFEVRGDTNLGWGGDDGKVWVCGSRGHEPWARGLQQLTFLLFRHGIIPAGAPGMAPCNPFYPQPGAFEGPPFLYGLYRVLRTGWGMAAVGPQQWGYAQLVQANGENEYLF